MDQDPFYQVKNEVESAFKTLTALAEAHARRSDDWTLSELKAALSMIHPDIQELDESVQAIEEPGVARRLGIDAGEVRRRRDFVSRVREEIAGIRGRTPGLASRSPSPEAYRARYGATAGLRTVVHPTETTVAPGPSREGSEGSDEGGDSELQHQSLLVEQQDRTLTDIAGTVGLLREQARVIGTEVFEQNSMLDDLDRQVDSTTSRLARAQRRMDSFMKDNSSSPSSWLVLGLIIILCILLFLVLFT
ncbi:hypothetical protein JCM16303_005646 [Sporobolomyces ruberrimus]